MRWGVRKEYEKVGRQKSTSDVLLPDLNDQSTWINTGSNDAYWNSYMDVYQYSEKYGSSKAFREYTVKQLGETGSTRIVDNYLKAFRKSGDMSLSNKDRDMWQNEAIRYGDEMRELIDQYTRDHPNDLTEEEIEINENWAKMVDIVGSDKIKEALANGSTVSMTMTWDGEKSVPKYVFIGRDRNRIEFDFGDEDALIAYAKEEKNAKVDFRNSRGGKSREKNIDPNAKPVSLKKGKKIETSKQERNAKEINSKKGQEKINKDVSDLTKLIKLNTKGMDVFRRDNIINKRDYSKISSVDRTPQLKFASNVNQSLPSSSGKSKTKQTLSKIGSTIVNTVDTFIKSGSSMVKKMVDRGKKAG